MNKIATEEVLVVLEVIEEVMIAIEVLFQIKHIAKTEADFPAAVVYKMMTKEDFLDLIQGVIEALQVAMVIEAGFLVVVVCATMKEVVIRENKAVKEAIEIALQSTIVVHKTLIILIEVATVIEEDTVGTEVVEEDTVEIEVVEEDTVGTEVVEEDTVEIEVVEEDMVVVEEVEEVVVAAVVTMNQKVIILSI